MKEWYSRADILALNSMMLPQTKAGLSKVAEERNWDQDKNRSREVDGNGGKRREYHYTLLPHLVQAKIVSDAMIEALGEEPSDERELLVSESLWRRYEYAAGSMKETAQKRLKLVQELSKLTETMPKGVALVLVSETHKVPTRTLSRWMAEVKGLRRSDWLPALMPEHVGRTSKAACHPEAWDFIVGDYLRPSQPSFASCFARLKETAEAKGWAPIPAKVTLKRRIESEFPPAAIIMAREGQGAAAQLYPAQTRDKTVFHAMEATNADGHVFDVFVQWPDGSIGRPCLVGFQDIYSGMVLSHRISRTENKETTRLAIADMVESWGIPQHVYFDNGRAFMSKWITGRGMTHRFRFKIKEEEPKGVLTQLGVTVHNTTPYHGQAKPIERAWRDMVDRISRHPKLEGAFTGNRIDAKPENYRSRAIPIEDFRRFVAQEIMRHNTRTDRNTQTAKGRSFAEVFEESLNQIGTVVEKATPLQRQFLLLAGEGKTARSTNGEIHLEGNRYWSDHLVAHKGRRLMIRFDPENLHGGIYVYTMDGRYIDFAECIEAVGFNNSEAAREHAKNRRQFMKAQREMLRLGRLLTPAQVAAQIPDPSPLDIALPKVIGLDFAEGLPAPAAAQIDASFGSGLTASLGVSNIFDTPGAKKEDG